MRKHTIALVVYSVAVASEGHDEEPEVLRSPIRDAVNVNNTEPQAATAKRV